LYQLEDGVCNDHFYGLAVAEGAGYPLSILNMARVIAEKLEEQEKKKQCDTAKEIKEKNALVERLLMLKNSSLDDSSIKQYIIALKSKLTASLDYEE